MANKRTDVYRQSRVYGRRLRGRTNGRTMRVLVGIQTPLVNTHIQQPHNLPVLQPIAFEPAIPPPPHTYT